MDLFNKSQAKIESLLAQTMQIVQTRYSQSSQMFTVASVWGQIIFVLQNLVQFILFFIEDSITELNINTATRESSIYGIAASVGHFATRAGSAIGEVQITWNNADTTEVGGNAILIPNRAVVQFTDSGSQYILMLTQDTIRFNLASSSSYTAQIIQGIVKTAGFTGTGLPLQTYNVAERYTGSIENSEVYVYVNDVLYQTYDSLYDIPYNYNGVLVRTSVNQGIDIIFGNGNNGTIPINGATITVQYLETLGLAGNINADPTKINLEFNDTGIDIFGNSITLKDYLNVSCVIPPQLGSNQENVALTRILAPKTSRSYVLANPDSYIIFFEKYGTFSIIEAYNNVNSVYVDDQSIIYVLLVPDVTQLLTTNENYFNLQVSDFTLTDYQKTSILNVIELSGQKIVGTEVQIVDPITSLYVINTIITIFEGYDPDTIMNTIIDTYSQYFLSIRRRDIIPRSDLIALVESIPGVDSVMIFFVSQKNENYQLSVANLPETDPRRSILQGLNSFGDIVIAQNEIIIISGGWSDSNGVYYDVGADLTKLSSVNIEISSVTPVTYNTQINAINKASIKSS